MSTNIADACTTFGAYRDYGTQALDKFLRKKVMLQRLAQLFRNMSLPIPPIQNMLPISSINADLYRAMAVNCPWLNLPPYSDQNLDQLRALVDQSYGNLLKYMENNPLSRIQRLQDDLDSYFNQVTALANEQLGPLKDWTRCLNNACSSAQQGESIYTNAQSDAISQNFQQQFDQQGDQFTKVADTATQNAMAEMETAKEQLRSLRDWNFGTPP